MYGKFTAVILTIFLIIPNIVMAENIENEEWKIYHLTVNSGLFKVPYKITNGEVKSMEGYAGGGITVNLNSVNDDGKIEIVIPKNLVDPKAQFKEGVFDVFVDHEISRNYMEVVNTPCFNTVSIDFPSGTESIAVVVSYFSGQLPMTVISPINFVDMKSNYEPSDTITVSGCTDLALDAKELVLEVMNPAREILKTINIDPNIDGTFSSSFVINNESAINGTYLIKATYADQSVTNSFVIPEFPNVGLITFIAIFSTILILLSSRSIRFFHS